MLRFVGRRLVELIPLLFLLSLLVFGLFKLIPGDYLSDLQLNPAIPRERIQELRQSYGLDRPFYAQYFIWVGQVARGNLGYSFAQQRPARQLIGERLKNTLMLTLAALLLSLLFAVPLGLFCALGIGSWSDRLGLGLSLLGLSLPPLLSSLIFLYFAFWTGWFPIGGREGWLSLFLPSVTLALPGVAFFTRTLRLEMADALAQPYVVFAAAKGLSRGRVVYHALRNAVNPLISVLGLTLGSLLSGAVVVEKVFSWPGLGSLLVDSILSRDLFVAVNCVLVGALLVVVANLLAEMMLAWNDPRIRLP